MFPYKDTLQNIFSFKPNMVPQDVPVDNVFGGELMALCHETQKEDRHPSLLGSEVLGSTLRHTEGQINTFCEELRMFPHYLGAYIDPQTSSNTCHQSWI